MPLVEGSGPWQAPVMSGLARDTRLRLASEVSFVLRDDFLYLATSGERVRVMSSLLPVLHLFRRGTTLADAMKASASDTTLDWMELSSGLVDLFRHGILVVDEDSDVRYAPSAPGFGGARDHIAMLGDEPRTRAYVEAIRATVKPGDVVVDVGSGTGVLSVAAAQGGAKRVYAIERTGMTEVARKLFEENGVADRIVILQGTSTSVRLPERADVMVSEMVGNEPFDEQILAFTRDAHERLLRPGARLVPRRMVVEVVPVTVPEELRAEHFFTPGAVDRWSKDYGIDFRTLAYLRPSAPQMMLLSRSRASDLVRRGPAVMVCDIDLAQPPSQIDANTTVTVDDAGPVDGLLMRFTLDLGQGQSVTSCPWSVDGARHWGLPLWLLPRPASVSDREGLGVRYEFAGVRAKLTVGSLSDELDHDPS